MKLILLIAFLFSINLMVSCSSKKDSGALSPKEIADEEKRVSQIKSLLVNCQITLSELNSQSLNYGEGVIKLNEKLAGFSGSTQAVARIRGILLKNNRVLTSIKIYYGSGRQMFDTYAALFDGTTKKLVSSVLLGTYLDVISVIKKNPAGSLVGIDALVREEGKAANKIKEFTINVKDNTITLQ